jgi:hypothetical protein
MGWMIMLARDFLLIISNPVLAQPAMGDEEYLGSRLGPARARGNPGRPFVRLLCRH